MSKLWVIVCLCAACHLHGSAAFGLKLRTTTVATTSTTTSTTTAAPPSRRPPVYINNNIPTVDVNCIVHYECKKKLKQAPVPKPCVKYCVKFIECPSIQKIKGQAGQCVDLDESHVLQQHQEDVKNGVVKHDDVKDGDQVSVMQVAMIDFPCRPGFLPDDLGRCREVW